MAKYHWKISRAQQRRISEYYVYNNSTIRKTAEHFGVSKSYAHRALVEFQTDKKTANTELAVKVASLINKNTAERADRGGKTTKAKYSKKQ